jgi:hypothetical protein
LLDNPLSNVLPISRLRERFPDLQLAEYGRDDLASMNRLKPKSMFDMALTVWDTIITRHLHPVSPQAISRYVDDSDPKAVQAIQRLLKRKIIYDAYYAHVTMPVNGIPKTILEVLIGHVYPGMIHIADLEFSGPNAPIPASNRRYPMTKYRGLGLLGPFIDNVVTAAHSVKVSEITLSAPTLDHVALYERHGFAVPDTPRAAFARQMGMSFPMIRKV